MSGKLTRATVPMCPNRECGAKVELPPSPQKCPTCGEYYGGSWKAVDWGYHPVDVAGVVAEMRDAVRRYQGVGLFAGGPLCLSAAGVVLRGRGAFVRLRAFVVVVRLL